MESAESSSSWSYSTNTDNALTTAEVCLSVRGGLRPQLGPDVVAQRGPKMPQKSPLWRITRPPATAGRRAIRQRGDFGGILGRFGAFLGPQKAFKDVLVHFQGPKRP